MRCDMRRRHRDGIKNSAKSSAGFKFWTCGNETIVEILIEIISCGNFVLKMTTERAKNVENSSAKI